MQNKGEPINQSLMQRMVHCSWLEAGAKQKDNNLNVANVMLIIQIPNFNQKEIFVLQSSIEARTKHQEIDRIVSFKIQNILFFLKLVILSSDVTSLPVEMS